MRRQSLRALNNGSGDFTAGQRGNSQRRGPMQGRKSKTCMHHANLPNSSM